MWLIYRGQLEENWTVLKDCGQNRLDFRSLLSRWEWEEELLIIKRYDENRHRKKKIRICI